MTTSTYAVTSRIWVTFRLPGIHRYPDAPDEVAYLRNEHRHVFHFRVEVNVYHDDREIEFHMFLNEVRGWYQDSTLQLDHKSCEMLARELLTKLAARWPGRTFTVDVSEDGECGATLTSTPVV